MPAVAVGVSPSSRNVEARALEGENSASECGGSAASGSEEERTNVDARDAAEAEQAASGGGKGGNAVEVGPSASQSTSSSHDLSPQEASGTASAEGAEGAEAGAAAASERPFVRDGIAEKYPIRTPKGAAALERIRQLQQRRYQLYSRLADRQEEQYNSRQEQYNGRHEAAEGAAHRDEKVQGTAAADTSTASQTPLSPPGTINGQGGRPAAISAALLPAAAPEASGEEEWQRRFPGSRDAAVQTDEGQVMDVDREAAARDEREGGEPFEIPEGTSVAALRDRGRASSQAATRSATAAHRAATASAIAAEAAEKAARSAQAASAAAER